MKLEYMNKRITDAIKGISLIFMFIHHFFTFPTWYVDGISYPQLEGIAEYFGQPFRMCVPVFAFLTGYFYFFVSEKNLRYSFRKIADIYLHYWAVYLPFLLFSLATGCFHFVLSDVLFELLALRMPIMCFCWYVVFYVLAMLILPVLTKISRTPFGDTVSLLIIPVAGGVFLLNFCSNDLLVKCLDNMVTWFPCVATGYLCSKYGFFSELDRIVDSFQNKKIMVVLCIIMVAGSFMSRCIGCSIVLGSLLVYGNDNALLLSADVIRAPLFVYGCAKLLYQIPKSRLITLLGSIGKKSLLMWFLHCIFFNCCKEITQPILYLPKVPLLVLIFGLLLCYAATIPIEYALGHFCKRQVK